jgi:Rhodanese-like domain
MIFFMLLLPRSCWTFRHPPRRRKPDQLIGRIRIGYRLGRERDPVEVPAPGDGLRLRDDLLAPTARVAGAGVWQRLHEPSLRKRHEADRIDWARTVIHSPHLRAVGERGRGRAARSGRRRASRLRRRAHADLMPTPIDRHELQRLIGEQQAQLVEVLPAAEYEDEHLPRAINIPLKELDRETTRLLERDRPVVVYCYDTQ